MQPFYLALTLMAFRAAALTLSTGELSFAELEAPLAAAFPNTFVLQIEPALLGDAHAALSALACASVHSYLPPSALLVHLPTAACHARAVALPHTAAAAPLPARLKAPPAVLTAAGEWAPAPAPAQQQPVRALRLQLAAGGLAGVEAFLAPHLPALCPTCTLHAASGDGGHVLLTSLSNCPAAAACTFASPASCGCTVPAALLRLLATYHGLFYVEPAGAPAQAYNAFQRELTLTSDLLNSPSIAAEFGACAEAGSCELSRFIPVSQAAAFLDSAAAAAALASGSGAGRAAAARAAAAAAAAAAPPAGQPLLDLDSLAPGVAPVPAPAAASAAAAAAAAAGTPGVVVVVGEMAAVAAQQREIWGAPAAAGAALGARRAGGGGAAARALQGSCSLTCSGPSCGQGFGTCNDLDTYVDSLLTGAGQLIHMVDDGLDFGNPFFLDSRAPATTGFQPSRSLPIALSTHSRVAAYFSYVDALDDERGHGTHVAGSISGSAVDAALTPADASALQDHRGSAPSARLIVTDVGCTLAPAGTCPMTGNSVPWGGGFSPCGESLCVPADWNVTFGAPRAAGAFVSGNSWGSSSQSEYATLTASLDAWVHANPDFLPVFAAANEGENGFLTLSPQATAKNVLTVGATNDGPIAHLAKIALFFQSPSDSGCTNILTGAVQQGLLTGPAPCPAVLNADVCSRLADASQLRTLNVPGGTQSRFNTSGNIEIPLCCGCTPADVLEGYSARFNAGDAAAAGAFEQTAITYMETYQGRQRAAFSSKGPTQDGRIKPDVVAPGWDTVSASGRGSGTTRGTADPPPYGTFTCAAGGTTIGATPWPGQAVQSYTGPPTGLASPIALVNVDVVEPTRIVNVSLPYQSLTAGTYVLDFITILRKQGGAARFMTPLRFTTAGTATPGTLFFSDINMEVSAGWQGIVVVRASAGAVLTTFGSQAGTAPTMQETCWGQLQNSLLITISTERGGGLGYTTTESGTSMATPHVTGLAALVRQYYTGGRYTLPGGAAGVPFTPSAALLKGTLINSASPLIYEALNLIAPGVFPPASAALLQASGGFGVPNLVRGLQFPGLGSATSASRALPSLLLPGLTVSAAGAGVDPALANGELQTYCIDVAPRAAGLAADAGLPLSLTLVYTDPPGNPLASWYLVNNLDLLLLPPGGAFTIYGNNNVSSPTQSPDGRNNVEKIELRAPAPSLNADGTRATAPYAVTVRGTSVPLGPRQAYSLVATGPGLALAAAGSCVAAGGGAAAPAAAPPAAALPAPAVAAIVVLGLLAAGLGVAVAVLLWRQRAAQAQKPQAWTSAGSPAAAGGVVLNPVAAAGIRQ